MKKFAYISRLLLLFLLPGCEGIFAPDPVDPRLPKFTESGNNVAGALVNGEVWQSVISIYPGQAMFLARNSPKITSFYNRDSLVIKFNGTLEDDLFSVEFHLKGWKIEKFSDFSMLKNKKIELNGTANTGTAILYNSSEDLVYYGTQGIGQLYIKQVLFENDSSDVAIFSGTFGFTCFDKLHKPCEVSYGRFDYTLNVGYVFFVE